MKRMKPIVSILVWLGNTGASWIADLAGYQFLGLFGWSLSASTVYMLFEVVSNVKRPGLHRFYLVLIGLFIGMAFGPAIAEYWKLNVVATVSGLSLFGYVAMGPVKDFIAKYIAKKAQLLIDKENEDEPIIPPAP